jgi:hypothetical protein
MPEEHTGQLGFEYAWKELLARSRQSGSHVALLDYSQLKKICRMLRDVQLDSL